MSLLEEAIKKSDEIKKKIKSKYYFIVMTQQELLNNQVIEELLREKASYYNSKELGLDFWVVLRPKFLTDIYDNIIQKTLYYTMNYNFINYGSSNYYAVVITKDYDYINWIKLRIGYFEPIVLPSYLTPDTSLVTAQMNFLNLKTDQTEDLSNNPSLYDSALYKVVTNSKKDIKIDGIYGELNVQNLPSEFSPLDYPKKIEDQLHPEILIKQYSQLLKRVNKLKEINYKLNLKK